MSYNINKPNIPINTNNKGNVINNQINTTGTEEHRIKIPLPHDVVHDPTIFTIGDNTEIINIHEYINISRNNHVYSFHEYSDDLNTLHNKLLPIGYVDIKSKTTILNKAKEISKKISTNGYSNNNSIIDKIDDYANIYIDNRYLYDSSDTNSGYDYKFNLYNTTTFQKILDVNIFPLRDEIVNNPNIIITDIYYDRRNTISNIDKEYDIDSKIQKDNSVCEIAESTNYQIFNTELFENNNNKILIDLKNNYVFDDNLYDYVKFIDDLNVDSFSSDEIERNIKFSFFDSYTLNNDLIKGSKNVGLMMSNTTNIKLLAKDNLDFPIYMLFMSNFYEKLYALFTDKNNKYLKDEFFLNNVFDDYYNNIIKTITLVSYTIPQDKDTLISETDQLKEDIMIRYTDKINDFCYSKFYSNDIDEKTIHDYNIFFKNFFDYRHDVTIDINKIRTLTYSDYFNEIIKPFIDVLEPQYATFPKFFYNNLYNIFNMKSYNVIAQLAYYKYFYKVIYYNAIATKYIYNYDTDFNINKHEDQLNQLLNDINNEIYKENQKNKDIVEISNKKNEYLESSRTYNNVKLQLINSNEVINSNIEDYNSRLKYDNNLKIFSKILYVVLLVILILFLINIIYIPEYRIKIVNNSFIIFITIILIIYVNYYYQKNSDKYEHFDTNYSNLKENTCYITFYGNNSDKILRVIFKYDQTLHNNIFNTTLNTNKFFKDYSNNKDDDSVQGFIKLYLDIKDIAHSLNYSIENENNKKELFTYIHDTLNIANIKITNDKNCPNLNSPDPTATVSIDNKYRELAINMSKYIDVVNNYLNVVSYNLSNSFNKNILKKSTEGVDYSIKKTKDKLQNITVIKNNLLSNRNNIKFTTLNNYNYNMFFCLSLLVLILVYTLYTIFYPYYLYPILFIGIILYIILLFIYIFHVKRIVHVDTDKRYWAKQIF